MSDVRLAIVWQAQEHINNGRPIDAILAYARAAGWQDVLDAIAAIAKAEGK